MPARQPMAKADRELFANRNFIYQFQKKRQAVHARLFFIVFLKD
jgi:hypothetical protein